MITRAALSKRLRHLPTALAASGVGLVLAAVAGLVFAGPAGAAGAAGGVALVSVGYVLSHLAVAWADAVNRKMVLPVGLTVYSAKFILLGIWLAALGETHWAGLNAMAFSMVGAVIVWTTTQAVWTWKARIPYVEIEPS
ncbi:hypothetical protein R8Z50_05420 [Longispora sp. K20-0274]|uniref:hypothetical protein n=1 Tax=Longispora sp. K20-0274 TaxID=3088255 RepID=UPI003999F004